MPLYEYQCEKCRNKIEKFFKISEKPKKIVDKCLICNENRNFEAIFNSIPISYLGINHSAKVPSILKDRLNQIRKNYPDMRSTV